MFLDDYHDAVTDLGSPLLSNNQSALNQRGTGVVDAIQDGL